MSILAATRAPVPAHRARSLGRRGTVAVALIIALVILSLVVVGMAMSGSMHQSTTAVGIQGTRAQYAADAASAMAIKEIMDDTDRDGDGAVGTISDDGNTATDPVISGTRLWATKSGSVVTARSANNDAARATQITVTAAAAGGGATILLVTATGTLNAQETARKAILEGWGYTVATITQGSSSGTFDTTCRTVSQAYVPESITSSTLDNKLVDQTIPVVNEEQSMSDTFGFSDGDGSFSSSQIDITSTAHYITSPFTTGARTICTSSQPLHTMTSGYGDFLSLAERVSSSDRVLGVMEREDNTCNEDQEAEGRRVHLPWGGAGFDINTLNTDGLNIMRRSLEWAVMPVSHWKLNDASGATAADSNSSRNGTISGATWTTGKLGGALSFDGTNDYVQVADNELFRVTNALTVAAWVNGTTWSAATDVGLVLRKGDSGPNDWGMGITDGRVELLLDDTDDTGYQGATVLPTGTWVHVAGTWDGSLVRLYVNGVLDNTPVSRTSSISTDSRPVYMGGRTGSTDVLHGKLDDVRFYNRALTAAEIARLANPGATVDSWQMVAP